MLLVSITDITTDPPTTREVFPAQRITFGRTGAIVWREDAPATHYGRTEFELRVTAGPVTTEAGV